MLVLTYRMIDSNEEEQREFVTEISAGKFIDSNIDLFEYYYLEDMNGVEVLSC